MKLAAAAAAAASSSSRKVAPCPSNFEQQQNEYLSRVDQMLDKERLENKSKKWNKLDNSIRIEKLHEFAQTKYLVLLSARTTTGDDDDEATRKGGEREGDEPDPVAAAAIVEKLKLFFNEILQKKKLLKAKEVVYDQVTGIVDDIPSLQYDGERGFFYLKSKDSVTNRLSSTVKSLTPKKII